MKYNIEDLEKKLLSYKLDKNQKEVLKKITDFIEYPLSFDCCLTGNRKNTINEGFSKNTKGQ